MDKSTIDTAAPLQPGMNFSHMVTNGVSWLQQFSGDTWTDHNRHDPGITVLESFSYALTDLSYRLNFPIEDLLQANNNTATLGGESGDNFTAAHKSLTHNPVTAADYRMLLLDIPLVRNVEVSYGDCGMWQITVEPEPSAFNGEPSANKEHLRELITSKFHAHRNLGEDLEFVKFIENFSIVVRLDLSLAKNSDVELEVIKVLNRVERYLSPKLLRENPNVLAEAGMSGGEIYSVTTGINGIVTQQQLAELKRREEVLSADLINEIKQQERVVAVSDIALAISDATDASTITVWERWVVDVREQVPSSDASLFSDVIKSGAALNLPATLSLLNVVVDGQAVILDKEKLMAQLASDLEPLAPISSCLTYGLQAGKNRNLAKYRPLQHDLPAIYGVNAEGYRSDQKGDSANQARQLQGYLTLFDQVLSDSFAQLAHGQALLAQPVVKYFKPINQAFDHMLAGKKLSRAMVSKFWLGINALPKTQHSQPLSGLNLLPELLGDYFRCYQKPVFHQLMEQPFEVTKLQRLVRSLEHLLARFGESATDANILAYRNAFEPYLVLINPPGKRQTSQQPDNAHELSFTDDENNFLNSLVLLKRVSDLVAIVDSAPKITAGRGQSIDYTEAPVWGQHAVSPWAERLQRKLGIAGNESRALAMINREGFHVIEGVLLRHGEGSYVHGMAREIYVIFPNWPTRFRTSSLQDNENQIQAFAEADNLELQGVPAFIEQLLQQETPLHLVPVLMFINREQMAALEIVYSQWRFSLRDNSSSERTKTMADLLINVIKSLRTGDELPDISAAQTKENSSRAIGNSYRVAASEVSEHKLTAANSGIGSGSIPAINSTEATLQVAFSVPVNVIQD